MSSEKESKSIFCGKVLFLSLVISVMILLLVILLFDTNDISYWFQDYGGLIGSIFAVISAVLAISYQSINIQKQIKAQQVLEEKKLLRTKIEEAYEVASGLRDQVMFSDYHASTNGTRDVRALSSKVEKVVMLCDLHGLVSKNISENYWDTGVKLFDFWVNELNANQYKSIKLSRSPQVILMVENFISATDALIEDLVLKMEYINCNL